MKFCLKKIWFPVAFAVVTLFAAVSEIAYRNSDCREAVFAAFKNQLDEKQKQASETLGNLKHFIEENPVDSLVNMDFAKNDISYYVFDNENLLFWSDNHIDIENLNIAENNVWTYAELANAKCAAISETEGKFRVIALITIKYNFPFENERIKNSFAKSFKTNKEIDVETGSADDITAISSDGHYLFALSMPQVIKNNFWQWTGGIAEIIAFLLILLLYVWIVREDTLVEYAIKTLCLWVLTAASLWLQFPYCIYNLPFASPFPYSSNLLMSSLLHLSIITASLFCSVLAFVFKVRIAENQRKIAFGIAAFLLAIFAFGFITAISRDSSFRLTMLEPSDINAVNIWAHLLVFLWGAMIFTVLSRIFTSFKKRISIYTTVFALVYATVFVFVSVTVQRIKKEEKYRFIAENLFADQNYENTRSDELIFEELDKKFKAEIRLTKVTVNQDSIENLTRYLNQNYLRGIWSRYELKLNFASKNSDILLQYSTLIHNSANKIKNTNFYYIPSAYNQMNYLGVYQAITDNGDSIGVYLELFQRKNFKSYSFPRLLASQTPDVQEKMGVASAKYFKGELVYSSENADFPIYGVWKNPENKTFFKIREQKLMYFIYQPDTDNQIIVTRIEPYGIGAYLIYFAYVVVIFMFLSWFCLLLFKIFTNGKNMHLGLTAKFQYSFIILLIFSFIGIFYISLNFINQKYRAEQLSHIKNKKDYIQQALQEMYYWIEDLSDVNLQEFNVNLQELSFTYQTDIFVYNNRGELVGSSQPLIFAKNLISKQISPLAYFSENSDINCEEHIGNLNYLTGYVDFLNGDYLQTGYIAVPQFMSREEIRKELEKFISVVVHIYLIITLLSVILSLLIGKQISAPLILMENKLKQMNFGQRNEKIDYRPNDEIGQLVAQYNQTVDKLERSAARLAQSERESAWKTMARQIAHEINNPLTPMKLTIQQLQRTKKMDSEKFDAYFERAANTLIEQIDNLSRIAGEFSQFAKLPEPEMEMVDAATVLASVANLFDNSNEQIIIVSHGWQNGIFITADSKQLTQVFNNLLKNAIQSIPYGYNGVIETNIYVENSEVIITVSDNGCGISPASAEKLFEPNFTTKSSGMGLGLTITKRIVESFDGKINFTSEEGRGTEFVVKFKELKV